jgi:hypothetical protein
LLWLTLFKKWPLWFLIARLAWINNDHGKL